MTNDGLTLLAYARRGIECAWREGYGITKAGIMLGDLIEADRRPRTLFKEDNGQRDRLMVAMDQVDMRLG